MILRHLSVHEFRNCAALRQEFGPSLNLLVGPNAQGKSSLLEAAYLLATSKSFRSSRDVEMIRWDAPAALVTGEVLREKNSDVELEVALSRTEKKALVVNTVRVSRAMEFVGQLKAVSFSASDLEVVRGEPARRRRFLDLEISQLSPSYCHALGCYRKVVEQRSRVLKLGRDRSQRAGLEDHLAAWTEQLVTYGCRLMERRRQFLERLEELARPVHRRISGDTELLALSYAPSFCTSSRTSSPAAPGQTEEAFRQALREVREEEWRRQLCLVGPHRDDVSILLNGREARTYASQGQQRSAALAMRLAEIELMRDLTGESPLCLLDDVFSELDEARRAQIFQVVGAGCQILLSTTDLELVPAEVAKGAEVFRVQEGALCATPARPPSGEGKQAARPIPVVEGDVESGSRR